MVEIFSFFYCTGNWNVRNTMTVVLGTNHCMYAHQVLPQRTWLRPCDHGSWVVPVPWYRMGWSFLVWHSRSWCLGTLGSHHPADLLLMLSLSACWLQSHNILVKTFHQNTYIKLIELIRIITACLYQWFQLKKIFFFFK